MRLSQLGTILTATLLIILPVATTRAGGSPTESQDATITIVCTTSIVGDVVGMVVGDNADLKVLIGPGENPHGYEPTPSDFRALERADIVFVNGFGLEESLLDDIEAIAGAAVVSVSERLEPRNTGDHQGTVDPHVWMDPRNVIQWVRTIVESVSARAPESTLQFRENGAAYIAELENLDRAIRDQVDEIPEDQRRLVLGHDSLGYFAEAYGFQIIGAIVPSTGSAEPSARAVAVLVETVREAGAQAIFVEHGAPRSLSELADRIAQEIGREVRIVPLLTSSLAEPGERGDSYITMIGYNVEQILRGLKALE